MSLLANKAVFFSSVFGVLVIVASAALAGWDLVHTVGVALLGVGGILAGAAATRWLHLVERRNLLKRWMEERALAETERLEYFDQVTNAEVEEPSEADPYLALLQLEYFRRYHFDVQRSYYENRAVDHERSADKIADRESWAVMLSSIGTGLGAGGAAFLNPNWVPLAGLGIFASALASWSAAQEALGQHRRNAERYQRTAQTLGKLAGELDRVGRAAYKGNKKAVGLFVEAVNNELSVEHRQWLEDIEGANKAVVRLRESLKESEEGEGAPAPA